MNKITLLAATLLLLLIYACSDDMDTTVAHSNDSILSDATRALTIIDDRTNKYDESRYSEPLTAEENAIGDALSDFAFRFMKHVAANADSNVCVSPYSIDILLSMLAAGAAGNTQEEICNAMGLSSADASALHLYNKKLALLLCEQDTSLAMNIANAAWMQYTMPVYRSYQDFITHIYDGIVKGIDFNDQQAGQTINNWCTKQTNGLINQIVEDGPLTPVQLIMANAVYLNAPWTSGFSEHSTSTETFTQENGTTSMVPMMTQKSCFKKATGDLYDILSMPIGTKADMSMNIAMPHAGVSLNSCLESLNTKTWRSTLEGSENMNIELKLPRFDMDAKMNLVSILRSLGIKSLFDVETADLSAISPSHLFISMIEQDTKLNVKERGIEATAVTFCYILTAGEDEPYYHSFHADRPFFFTIEDNTTGAILFMGAVRNL